LISNHDKLIINKIFFNDNKKYFCQNINKLSLIENE
jgi:hypothetical protein